MNLKGSLPETRSYRQRARAEAAEATGRRILDSFLRRAETEWFDKIRLEDIAADAGVTVQTVIRRFGGKQGLLEAAHRRLGESISIRRTVTKGDLDHAVDVLSNDYEAVGRLVLRLLDQEEMHPALKPTLDLGRRFHREWLEQVFEGELAGKAPARRRATVDALVVATDLYIWKLVRIDMGRPIPAFKRIVRIMLLAALADQGQG